MYFGPYIIKANLLCHSHHTPGLIAGQEKKKITKISIYLFPHNSHLPSSPTPVFQLFNYASTLTLLESGSVQLSQPPRIVAISAEHYWHALLLLRLNYFEISAFSYFSSPRLPYEGCVGFFFTSTQINNESISKSWSANWKKNEQDSSFSDFSPRWFKILTFPLS